MARLKINSYRDFEEYAEFTSRKRRDTSRRSTRQDSGDDKQQHFINLEQGTVGHDNVSKPNKPSDVHVGDVYFSPNHDLRIRNWRTTDHPTVCFDLPLDDIPQQNLLILKGTDSNGINPFYRSAYLIFKGSPLVKPTAFSKTPISLPFRTVKLYYPERYLGRLDGNEQQELFQARDRYREKIASLEQEH